MINKLKSFITKLDAGKYPEAYDYLQAVIGWGDDLDDTEYDLADALMNCDKPKDYEREMIDFIIELYQSAVKDGNDNAMNDLGAMYYDGKRGCEQSFEKAVFYYEMAAQRGNLIAHENLGYCWYYGRTGKKDYEKAYRCFAYCALSGSLVSLYKIGDMYLNGYYLPQSDYRAFHMYLRCQTLMNEDQAPIAAGPLYLRLGKMYLYGIGTEMDAKRALVCFQKAESYLYDMVESGDHMYEGSLKAAIDGQSKARERLNEGLSKRAEI